MRERNMYTPRELYVGLYNTVKISKLQYKWERRTNSWKMELPVTGVSNCVVRLAIIYSTTKNKTTREIYRKVCETFGQGEITEQKVGEWRHAFSKRWRDVHDLPQISRTDDAHHVLGFEGYSVCRISRPSGDSHSGLPLRYPLVITECNRMEMTRTFQPWSPPAAEWQCQDPYCWDYEAPAGRLIVWGVRLSCEFARHRPLRLLLLSEAKVGLRRTMFWDNSCVTEVRNASHQKFGHNALHVRHTQIGGFMRSVSIDARIISKNEFCVSIVDKIFLRRFQLFLPDFGRCERYFLDIPRTMRNF